MSQDFLQAVLGADAAAVLRSTDRGTVALQDAVSSAALAWAREALAGHRDTVPGRPSLTLMAKGEAWEIRGVGADGLGGFGAPQLAAVALHLWDLAPSLPEGSPQALARLGKALHALSKGSRKGAVPAGPAAVPKAPIAPAAPAAPKPVQTAPAAAAGKTPTPAAPAAPAPPAGGAPAAKGPKLPGAKKPRQATIGKSELGGCGTCALPLARCGCWGALSKTLSFEVDVQSDQVTVSFGAGWDLESMAAWLAEVRGG